MQLMSGRGTCIRSRSTLKESVTRTGCSSEFGRAKAMKELSVDICYVWLVHEKPGVSALCDIIRISDGVTRRLRLCVQSLAFFRL